jgi:hypothetical protein
MFNILDFTQNNVIAFEVTGKIEKEDYEKLIPLLEKTEREYDKINLFIELHELKGMTMKALLEDIKTYFKNIRKVRKAAIIGRNGFDQGITEITNFVVHAEIRYFTKKEYESARKWITE